MRLWSSFSVLTVCCAVSVAAAGAQRTQPGAATNRTRAIAHFDRGVILHERGELDAAIRRYRFTEERVLRWPLLVPEITCATRTPTTATMTPTTKSTQPTSKIIERDEAHQPNTTD